MNSATGLWPERTRTGEQSVRDALRQILVLSQDDLRCVFIVFPSSDQLTIDLQGERAWPASSKRWSQEAGTWSRPRRGAGPRKRRIQQHLRYDSLQSVKSLKLLSAQLSVTTCGSAVGARNHDNSFAYGGVETNTETDQTADTDASESNLPANRRRRSRRRRTDEEASLMDGMSESDNTSLSENGIGMKVT